MAKRNTLIPLKDKIAILDKSYQALEIFIKKRLFGFTVYDGEKAKKLKAEIFEKIDRQDKINRLWAGINIPLAYNRAAGIAKKRLEKIGAKVKKKRFDLVSAQSKKNGALSLISYMNAANNKIRETVTQYFKLLQKAHKKTAVLQNFQLQNLVDNKEILQGTEKIIKASIIPVERVTKAGFTYMATPSRGEVQREIKKLFSRVFGNFDFISITMKNGKIRNYNPRKYMEMLTRTQMRAIQIQAVKDRCREFQNDLVIIPPHDDPCPICEPYQGQVFSLSGKHPFYPPVIDIPIHPNCEDHYSPTSEDAIAIEKKYGKKFPKPYRKSIQERIDEVRKRKAKPPALKKPKPKIRKKMEEMTPTERAVNEYTGSGYKEINPYLRGLTKPSQYRKEYLNESVDLLNKYLNSAKKYKGDSYRIIAFKEKQDFINFTNKLELNRGITDRAFLSTSQSYDAIRYDSGLFKDKPYLTILRIKSKTGVDIQNLSTNPDDLEVLFKPNTKLKLNKIIRKEDNVKVKFGGRLVQSDMSEYEYYLEEL